MKIGFLGPLEVRDGERVIEVAGPRLRTLLCRLAIDVGKPVSADALTEAVWPEAAPGDPANALQSLVSRLRRALGDASVVDQSAAGYRLALEPDDVDAGRFAALAHEGADQLARGDASAAAQTLVEALRLWRGDPLPDDSSVDAHAVRARLTECRDRAATDLLQAQLALGQSARVLGAVEALLKADPQREDLVLLKLRALVAEGRPGEALVAYEQTRRLLAESLGADPSTRLQALYADLLRANTAQAPATTNVRARATSFVGREADVARVARLLEDCRLVSVVGAGGSGKTRLVTEVAAARIDGEPDGVWFVELAPVSDAEGMALAVLDALGDRDVALFDQLGDRTTLAAPDRVLQELQDSSCLIVLDNCEHIIFAAAEFAADLLGRCPGVRIIATSREPLGVDGETLYALSPLDVPSETPTPEDALQSPAVKLLLDRARAVGADLVLDADTTAAVVEVVRRLDGLPLAIELAAARLRVLSIHEVAARLSDRFRLLTAGRRTAVPRHRTLRAVVEWSWDLLSVEEREVAEHFCVFAGGATAAAVAAVSPSWREAAASPAFDDVLSALVDKSLLVAEPDSGGTRFRMLETLREYGSERLTEVARLDDARTAHARYFTALVIDYDAKLRTSEQLAALRGLDTDRENFLAALAFLGDRGNGPGAIAIAVHLAWYWLLRENGPDGARWLRFALAAPGAASSEAYPLAEALAMLYAFAAPSDLETGYGSEDLLAVATQLHGAKLRLDDHVQQVIPVIEPMLFFFADDHQTATQLIAANTRHGDPWVQAASRTLALALAENDGDLDTMRREIDLVLAAWTPIGDSWGIATLLTTRAQLRTVDGELAGAEADFTEAQVHMRKLGSVGDDVLATMRLADLRARAGDPAGARRYAEVLWSERRHVGTWGASAALFGDVLAARIGILEDDDAAIAGAHQRIALALDAAGAANPFQAHSRAVAGACLVQLDVRAGDLDGAHRRARATYELAVLTKDLPVIATVGVSVAGLFCARSLNRQAAVILGAAARLRGSPDSTELSIAALTTSLRGAMGSAFEGAYAAGLALDRAAAIGAVDPDGAASEAGEIDHTARR